MNLQVYRFSDKLIDNNPEAFTSTSFDYLTSQMVTMIPVSSPRDPMAAFRYQQVYRSAWVPTGSMYARGPLNQNQACLQTSFSQQQLNAARGRIASCASEDEISAAKVLLNLSPKAPREPSRKLPVSPLLKENAPESTGMSLLSSIPGSISVPSGYLQRWKFYHNQEKEHDVLSDASSLHPSNVSETSSEPEEESLSSTEYPCSPVLSAIEPVHDADWHQGSVSLALDEDNDTLSPLHCFMRRYCVEAFSSSPEDVAVPRYGKSHGVKVVVGQVGIRCLYCSHRKPGKRPERAVCFPSSVRNIYHSIETWQRRHSAVCEDIPTWVRKNLQNLMESSKSRAGGRRKYWEDSARRLGLVDTPEGVRFSRKPGIVQDLVASIPLSIPVGDSKPIVQGDDRELVTDYLYCLMEQMETCQFTEEDRSGGRSKIKDNEVGFPGMQCKHCQGKAGFGRYFPTSASALALANSDRNIFNHLQKCRRCPDHMKSELQQLSKGQAQSKNRRGLRKMFFQRVWSRIHHEKA